MTSISPRNNRTDFRRLVCDPCCIMLSTCCTTYLWENAFCRECLLYPHVTSSCAARCCALVAPHFFERMPSIENVFYIPTSSSCAARCCALVAPPKIFERMPWCLRLLERMPSISPRNCRADCRECVPGVNRTMTPLVLSMCSWARKRTVCLNVICVCWWRCVCM